MKYLYPYHTSLTLERKITLIICSFYISLSIYQLHVIDKQKTVFNSLKLYMQTNRYTHFNTKHNVVQQTESIASGYTLLQQAKSIDHFIRLQKIVRCEQTSNNAILLDKLKLYGHRGDFNILQSIRINIQFDII